MENVKAWKDYRFKKMMNHLKKANEYSKLAERQVQKIIEIENVQVWKKYFLTKIFNDWVKEKNNSTK